MRPCASIHARLRCTAARLDLVSASAIGAETRGHSANIARKAGGVFPESALILASAFVDHASISSRCRMAVRQASSIPVSQRSNLSRGGLFLPTPEPLAHGEALTLSAGLHRGPRAVDPRG